MESTSKLKLFVSRRYGVLMRDMIVKAFTDPKNMGHFFGLDFFIPVGEWNNGLYYGDENIEFAKRIFSFELEKPHFIQRYLEIQYAEGNELLAMAEQYAGANFRGEDTHQMIQKLKGVWERYTNFLVVLGGVHLQDPLTDYLKSKFPPLVNIDATLSLLTLPQKKNEVTFERKDFLSLGDSLRDELQTVIELNQLSPQAQKQIAEHATKYGWFSRGGLDKTIEAQDVFDKLLSEKMTDFVAGLTDLAQHEEDQWQQRAQLLEKLQPDEEFQRIIELGQELVYFRTWRSDTINLILFRLKRVIAEIGKRIGNYTYEQTRFLRLEEFFNLLPVSVDELNKRIQNFILFTPEPGEVVFSSDPKEIEKFREMYFENSTVESADSVKGNIAYPGKVRGRVVIVLSKSELSKVKEGDILITPMTTPDYLVGMHLAGAFVTNEGGITCHAAIVAREMKKPCVIGTRFATKIFKDGDVVEVDADAGTVRKL